MKYGRLFLQVLFIAYCICVSTGRAGAVIVAEEPFNTLSDPVLGLQHSRAQLAFELASKWMVHACNALAFHHMWIFVQTSRPEGTYVLAYGSIWVAEDVAAGKQPLIDLDNDSHGEVDLIRKDRSCAFEGEVTDAKFPFQPLHPADAEQAGIILTLRLISSAAS
jgi:hypothetical protein